MISVPIEWSKAFAGRISSYEGLFERAEKEYASCVVYPPKDKLFAALELVAPKDVRVVIIGQDPYHEKGQAMGVAFGVPHECKLPPSLRNIKKEIESEYGMGRFDQTLEYWCKQGVLLLNTSLMVREGEAMSLTNMGWDEFVDDVIRITDSLEKPVVYMLWGKHAIAKKKLLANKGHLVLESAHPSPLSASRGFFGNGHFKKCNEFLEAQGEAPIQWMEEEDA